MGRPLTNWWVVNNLTWPGHFRYSFLLQTLPYLEQGAASNAMNFNLPLYDLNGDDMPQNTTVYAMQVKGYLCPSDVRTQNIGTESPCNYAACSGDGLPGGFGLPAAYGKPDGVMYLNSTTSMANLIDGSSQTAMTESGKPRRQKTKTTTLFSLDMTWKARDYQLVDEIPLHAYHRLGYTKWETRR